ncbi:MAG: hypothetical protein MJD61_04930 [Proteobacteria bacterium]|nr:hypothetical protein [Pseudomonadota bacterium]
MAPTRSKSTAAIVAVLFVLPTSSLVAQTPGTQQASGGRPATAAASGSTPSSSASARSAPAPSSKKPAPRRVTRVSQRVYQTGPSDEELAAREQEGGPDLILIEPFVGVSYTHLKKFSDKNLLSAQSGTDLIRDDSGAGPVFGVMASLRLLLLSFGARVALARYPAFDLGLLLLEAGLRPKLSVFEPYLRVAGGYAWVGSANYQQPSESTTSVYGLAGELGFGFDARIAPTLAIGLGVDATLLNLSRQTKSPTALVIADGSAVGASLRLQGHVTLHL